MYTNGDIELAEWFGSVLVRDRDALERLDQLDLIESSSRAPWHAEKYLVGERIKIDMSNVGGPIVLCEITNRRPCGDRIDLTVAPVESARGVLLPSAD